MFIKPKKKFFLTGVAPYYKAGSLPAPTFVSAGALTNSSGTWTTATANIGNPAYIGTRRVIVLASSLIASGRTVTGVTINGVTATVHLDSQGVNTEWIGCASVVVPSGTTNVTITFTMSSTLFANGRYAVYIVDNSTLLSGTPVVGTPVSTAGATSVAPTIAQTINGFVVGDCVWGSAASKSAGAVGSPDAVATDSIDGANTSYIFVSNLAASATTTETVTFSWTGSFSAISCLLAWR